MCVCEFDIEHKAQKDSTFILLVWFFEYSGYFSLSGIHRRNIQTKQCRTGNKKYSFVIISLAQSSPYNNTHSVPDQHKHIETCQTAHNDTNTSENLCGLQKDITMYIQFE